MNIAALVPLLTHQDAFRRNRERFIPEKSGNYVLSTLPGEVLYIGLTNNLRKRFNQHLDNPAKVAPTALGRAVIFHWIECSDTGLVERTWMNIHIQHEGALPLLNSVYSPSST
jgi:hypothetical protein